MVQDPGKLRAHLAMSWNLLEASWGGFLQKVPRFSRAPKFFRLQAWEFRAPLVVSWDRVRKRLSKGLQNRAGGFGGFRGGLLQGAPRVSRSVQAILGAFRGGSRASRGLHSLVGFLGWFKNHECFGPIWPCLGIYWKRLGQGSSRIQNLPGASPIRSVLGRVPPEGSKILQGSQVFQASRPGISGFSGRVWDLLADSGSGFPRKACRRFWGRFEGFLQKPCPSPHPKNGGLWLEAPKTPSKRPQIRLDASGDPWSPLEEAWKLLELLKTPQNCLHALETPRGPAQAPSRALQGVPGGDRRGPKGGRV